MSDADPLERQLARLAALADRTCADREPAHDALHVRRVARAARAIAVAESAVVTTAVAAGFLHELFNLPKDHPDSARAGELCADYAATALADVDWPAEQIEPVCYAIRVHGFSRGIVPRTLEARILQDADRLDAIGAVGIARCFATCADIKGRFYDAADPFAQTRELDDRRFAVDHFYRKLLRIPAGLHTATARQLAAERAAFMVQFLDQLGSEIGSPTIGAGDLTAD